MEITIKDKKYKLIEDIEETKYLTTPEEFISCLLDHDKGQNLYIEYRNYIDISNALIWARENLSFKTHCITKETLNINDYNIVWRAWRDIPTSQEKEAIEWR
jgi:hypothetical protein